MGGPGKVSLLAVRRADRKDGEDEPDAMYPPARCPSQQCVSLHA